MGRQFVLVCLLFGYLVLASSQTTDNVTAVNTTTAAPESTTVWVPPTGPIRCYECDNEPDNAICNGEDLGENGTLVVCDENAYEDPSCYHVIKYSDRGNGWSFSKGCMEWEECKELYYAQLDDPVVMSCMHAWYWYNPPPIPGVECIECCWKWGHWHFDKCNSMGYNTVHITLIDEGNNHWDHELDRWPGHEKAGYEEKAAAAAGIRMTLATLVSASFFSVLGALYI